MRGDHWEFTQRCCHGRNQIQFSVVIFFFFFAELKRDFSKVFIVFAGLEPKSFKNLFPFWEDRPDVAKINQTVS